jgi:hypothetical protein
MRSMRGAGRKWKRYAREARLAAQAGAVEAWIRGLARRFGSEPIAVAMEQTRAALLWQLSKYEHLHLYVVPPQTSA